MYHRRIKGAAAVYVAALAIASLTPDTAAAQSGAGDTQLSDAGRPVNVLVPTGTFQKVIEPLLMQFTKDTGIKINETAAMIPDVQSAELLDLTQKTGSYDAIVMDDTWLVQFKAHLLPLQQLVSKNNVDTHEFFAPLTKIFSQDGNQYAYPFGTSPWVLVYNANTLAAAGLAPPTTFAELKDVAAKLTKGGQHGLAAPLGDPSTLTTIWYQYAVNAGLKSFLNASSTKAEIDTDAGSAALSLFADLYKNGSMPPGTITYDAGGALTSVVSGESVMGVLPMANLYDVNNPANSKFAGQFKITANPVQSSSDKSVFLTSGWGVGISRYSRNQANAWNLTKYLINAFEKPNDSSPSFIVKYPNSESALASANTLKTYPGDAIAVVKTAAQSPVTRPITPYYQAVAVAVGRNLQGVFTGRTTVKAALQAAQNAANNVLK